MTVLRIKYRLRIMNSERTLRYIKKHRCSIARYGDGEFDLLFNMKDLGFQVRSQELARRLSQVLSIRDDRLLLCVPRCLNSIRGCNTRAKDFWIQWGRDNNHHKMIVRTIRSLTGCRYLFGDSQITRPYMDWENIKRAERTFPMLKSLWEGRDILIVEGENTRLGVGNDLYDGAMTIRRILAPSINAFQYYEEIKHSILDHYHGELIIIALGPTATVLAAELSTMDIQALDIGHIDIEYEWFLRRAEKKVAIPGKYTNESIEGHEVKECQNEEYLRQIIARIGC